MSDSGVFEALLTDFEVEGVVKDFMAVGVLVGFSALLVVGVVDVGVVFVLFDLCIVGMVAAADGVCSLIVGGSTVLEGVAIKAMGVVSRPVGVAIIAVGVNIVPVGVAIIPHNMGVALVATCVHPPTVGVGAVTGGGVGTPVVGMTVPTDCVHLTVGVVIVLNGARLAIVGVALRVEESFRGLLADSAWVWADPELSISETGTCGTKLGRCSVVDLFELKKQLSSRGGVCLSENGPQSCEFLCESLVCLSFLLRISAMSVPKWSSFSLSTIPKHTLKM